MKQTRKRFMFRVCVCLFAACATWIAVDSFGRPAARQPSVSRETTFFSEPVRTDGTIDYGAAINRRYSKAIKPEENACVLLQQALGPSKLLPPSFYIELGTNASSPDGTYIHSLNERELDLPPRMVPLPKLVCSKDQPYCGAAA